MGIFRYKNQSAIETDPIEVNEELIGWQAKFYETTLSQNKDDILGMLDKTKRDYPNISQIIFYTNAEWGQSKGKDPIGRFEIEKRASEYSINIEWRCKSYFESPFVVDTQKNITSYFFSESDSTYDRLKLLTSHTENLLYSIGTKIEFNNQDVLIDRTDIFNQLEAMKAQVIIINGDGGTGKTALIKSLYEKKDQHSAFYVHKASEFSVKKFEDCLCGISLDDFIMAHQGINTKVVVIDSAENLLNIANKELFKEYLSALLKNEWRILFTTRSNYFKDLTFQFIEIYNTHYESLNLVCLNGQQLEDLSKEHSFQLPNDQRLINLISVPFYLKEYLKAYQENKNKNYIEFRNSLWPKVIVKASPYREQQFIKIAVTKVNSEVFFVQASRETNEQQIEKEFCDDGIISYESPHGYFITHDIYEEWALEKHIEAQFLACKDALSFFTEIKQSLPVRRAFRTWFSEKLGDHDSSVFSMIQDSLNLAGISHLWMDEVLISILISEHSSFFFSSYRDQLLKDNCSLLKRISLLIRVGCIEMDDNYFKQMRLSSAEIISLELIQTKPKGSGWESLIRFVYENYTSIEARNIAFVLPVLSYWNSIYKKGETTKYSSLLALSYYEWKTAEGTYFQNDDTAKNLVCTILCGAQEIPSELSLLIEKIIENKWAKHGDPYNLFSTYILSKFEGAYVAHVLPEETINLAKLFWTYEPPTDEWYLNASMDLAHHFGISNDSQNYYPSSAYQTPIYHLLNIDPKRSLDFIIEFTNIATEKYSTSSLGQNEVKTVGVILNDKTVITQYISDRLWCLYRGTQVNPSILESIHMSLERFLLEYGKRASAKKLEDILYYILSRTSSAALSSLVTSLVIAFPEKTFRVAKVLFRTKEFFLYDTQRLILDQTHKTQLTVLKNNFGSNYMHEIHENERIKSCDEKHRKFSLENIMLNYQFFRTEHTSESEAAERLKEIYKILDIHYDALPNKENETEADMTWRIYLARMDKRKMEPTTKETEEGLIIEFNPKIDSELKECSDNAQKVYNETFKHSKLFLWVENRFYGNESCKNHENYESDPLSALEEVKDLLSETTTDCNTVSSYFSHSLPSVVCSVLLRDFCEKMNKKDLAFCKETVLSYGSLFLQKGYNYTHHDGVLPALLALPILLEYFPKEKRTITSLIVLALMQEYSINMNRTKMNEVVVNSLQSLWEKDFNCALSIYIGYLILSQKKKEMFIQYRKSAYEKGHNGIDRANFLNQFVEKHSDIFEQIANASIIEYTITDIHSIDIEFLVTAFQIIPLKTNRRDEIPYTKDIIKIIAEKILSNDRDEKIDYTTRRLFLKKYTQWILHLDQAEIKDALSPFIDNFTIGEGISYLLKQFIYSEDNINRPDHFWIVWELFKDKVVEASNRGGRRDYSSQIVKSYMFASTDWNVGTKEWHTFNQDRAVFFNELTTELSGNSSYLYCLSKLLYGVGSIYIEWGIQWLSYTIKMIENKPLGENSENTIFYLEKIVKKYILLNREKARKDAKVKAAIITILDFLVENQSIVGYLQREDIA